MDDPTVWPNHVGCVSDRSFSVLFGPDKASGRVPTHGACCRRGMSAAHEVEKALFPD
nr:hypothetical protein [uncultured Cohaesibacter sp.]